MKAFVEILSGIVRVGPECDRYGQPWVYCATFSSTDGKTAVLKALKSDGGLSQAHARAVIATVKALGFEHVEWDRIKPEGTRKIAA